MKKLLMVMVMAIMFTLWPMPPQAEAAPSCYFGACYSYATISSPVTLRGAKGVLSVESPDLGELGWHSLAELAISETDNPNGYAVEVGWRVGRTSSGQVVGPQLFVFHWDQSGPTCYNGCGFVQVSGQIRPGMNLPVGSRARFEIRHIGSRWALFYNGTEFGYYPDVLWGSPPPAHLTARVFGEVALRPGDSGRVEMGNGIRGHRPEAATARLVTTLPRGNCSSPFSTNMPRYTVRPIGLCGMAYGGR